MHVPPEAQTWVESVEPLQVEPPQTVFVGAAQLPPPLQFACWQLAASALHSFFGSLPELAFWQTPPVELTTMHVLQVSPAVAQRLSSCPCWQLPVLHWLSAVQTVPVLFFGTHVLLLQK